MLQSDALPQRHWMLDIETLDTKPSAVILSIGVCEIREMPEHGRIFYEEVAIWSQTTRTESFDTKEWWKTQKSCPDQGSVTLDEVLQRLTAFLKFYPEEPIIWCKGTDFDPVILADAYRYVFREPPWKYNHVRDFRTVKKLFGERVDATLENTSPHNALADAIFQAKQLHSIGLNLA